jgi:hypothetical protein
LGKINKEYMSHIRVKTTYNVMGAYGEVEKHTLYAHINNSCDIVDFYDEDGSRLFSVEDTMKNNLLDAINRLFIPYKSARDSSLNDGIEYMDEKDKEKCGL